MSEIKIFDSDLRAFVPSSSDPNKSYLVDIGLHICQCRHHRIVLYPKYRDNGATRGETMCKHLLALQEFLGGAEAVGELIIQASKEEEAARKNNGGIIGSYRYE